MTEQESEKSRAETWFEIGKRDMEQDGSFLKRNSHFFEFHADFQNYLAGVRAAVL